MVKRCTWCGDDPLYQQYHDEEWGVPQFDDRTLLEFLILEGAQAGLAWITVLRKREAYLKVFENFEPQRVARFSDRKLEKILTNEGIIRNRLKVFSARQNAQAFLKVQQEFGSFSDYLWGFINHKPIQNRRKSLGDLPAKTQLAEQISKDLKKRGFNFVGSTICYAFMQAVGMVNDHTINCYRHAELCS